MAQSTFPAPTPSPEITPAPMAASGPSRADKYYFAPKREHLEGTNANDKFYSYKDSAWVPRSALPDDAQIILVTYCHDMAGGPYKTLEEACEKNAEYLRAQIEAEQDASSGGGGSAGGGLTLEEVKALIAEAVAAHGTDATAHDTAIAAAVSAHSADTTAHVEAIKPLIATAVSEHGADTTAHASAISTAIGTHNTDPTAHPDIREAITSGGGGGGGDTPVAPPSAPVITMAERLLIGRTASIGLAATPADTASITKFSVTVNDGTPVDVAATANAATYSHTPTGTDGDTLTVKATATDNFDSISTEATATATLYDYVMPIYWDYNYSNARALWRSDDKGLSFKKISDAPKPLVASYQISHDRDKVYVCTYDETGTNRIMRIYCSQDLGATWTQLRELPRINICNGFVVTKSAMILSYNEIPEAGGSAVTRNEYSHDGGATWHSIDFAMKILAAQEISNGDIIAIIEGRTTRKSSDGGITWGYAGTNAPSSIQYFYALDNGKIIAINAKKEQYTLTGDTWSLTRTLTWTANTIIRADDSTLLMAGSVNTSSASPTRIWYSTNEGGGWYTRKDVGIGAIASLRNFGDGLIIAGGASGKLSRSTDYGVTWTTVDTKWPASTVLF